MFFKYLLSLCLLVTCFFLSQIHTLQAQTPGGVGSSIELWLRAEDLATTATTSDWTDRSGNSNNGLFHTNVGGGYGVSVNSINSNPTVIINDEWFESNANSNGNDLNVFIVYKLDQNNASLWGNDSSNTNGHDGRFATSQNVSRTNSATRNVAANTTGDIYIHHTQIGASSGVYINGTFNALNESGTRSNNTNVNQRNFDGIFLGRKETDETSSGDIRDMEIAEFIVYDGVLTNADRERISSYLAIKYGVQIDAYNYVLSNGNTIWDLGVANTGSNNYNHNIAGIAKDGGSGLEQLRSRSEESGNLLTISTTSSNLGANSALVWGHNDEDTDDEVAFASTENFFMKGERMERVWQCQEEGTVGNVEVKMPGLAPLFPSSFTGRNNVLVVADDENFTTGVKVFFAYVNSATELVAENVQLEDGEYFTFARMETSMWVKADDSNNQIAGSSVVNRLADNIGRVNDMIGTSGSRPNFIPATNSAAINFNPYVRFNQGGNTGQYLESPFFWGFDVSGTSVFLAVRRDNNNNTGTTFLGEADCFLSYATNSDDNAYLIEEPEDIDVLLSPGFGVANGHKANGFDVTDNIPHIIANIRGGGTDDLIRLDGRENSANYRRNDVIESAGSLIFGQEQDAVGGSFNSNQEYNGDWAEAIVMSERVSNQDRQIIESYLAIKYGITLNNDYYLANGTTRTWNRGANSGDYNNNIAGIGRDDFIQLNQVKSRSQNPTNVHVTIEKNSGNFPNNEAHLIWGCDTSDYDVFSVANAPSGVSKSEKIWSVSNNSNRITGVNVIMDIPPSLVAQPGFLPVLLTSATNNFSGATPLPGSIVNNEIVFSNVTLPDGSFFSLGVEEGIGFKNNDIGAPTSFEACPGSSISFVYNDFPTDPSFLTLTDTTGTSITIPMTLVFSNPSAGGVSGEVQCIVPPTAGSGNIALLDNNSIILYTRTNFIVHNPLINFFPTRDPLCATDTARMIGIPLGGVFSSGNPGLYPGIVSNDSIVGLAANWNGVTNEIVKSVDVTYTYTPRYIDGTPCLNSIPKTKTIQIRDNRINDLNYNYIITETSPPTTSDRKILNSSVGGATTNTLRDISPTIPASSNFDFSFTGTYVQEDVATNTYTFLTDQAVGSGVNSSFPVTLYYNNGGCVGEATNNIDVFPPLRFLGLADTLCRAALPSEFGRDPLPEYRDTIRNEFVTYSGTTISRNFRENRIVSVLVDTNAHPAAFQRAIDTIRTTVNDELYSFDPTAIPDSIPSVALVMVYQTTIETNTTTSSGTVRTRDTFDLIAFDTVYLEDRPVPQISGIDSFYCENATVDTLRPSPDFESVTRTYFTFNADNGFGFNGRDTLVQDTLFDPSYHYIRQVPNRDRNLPVQLIYTVDRYGCVDRDTAYTIIVAPVQPVILNNSPYCTSDLPTTINVGYAGLPPTGGSGVFLSAPGLDTTNTGFANFFPNQAGPGDLPITFEYTDFYKCIATVVDTLIVRTPPAIQVIADQVGKNEFCANDTSALLETLLLPSGTPANAPFYTGAGVFGNNFNPSIAFLGVGGTTTIQAEYTDSFGCKGYDTIRIQINAIPKLGLNGFNGVNSPTGAYDHKYCYNDSSFIISGSPSHLSGQGGAISGAGVVLIDSTYQYNPNFSGQNETTVNLITYTYTDNKGCSNIDTALVLVDSIPETTITGLDTAYCVNDLPVFAIGFPDTATFAGSSTYGGTGINPNTGSFDPSIAGVGRTILSYSFEDREGCANTAFDTIVVNPLPIPSFGGYDPQYCTADPSDTLESNNLVHPNSSYFFYGNLIIDSIGILSPDTSLIGVQTIFYSYTDSFGCTDIRSENIFIHPTPEVTVSGLDSAYCFNANKDIISIFPAPGFLTTNDKGFNYRGNTIEFTPGEDTAGVKSFTYIYVDLATTCSDTISARTYVHKPDVPEYTGLDTTYCEIRDTFALNGLSNGGSFSGLGIINDGNGNFSFSPAKASSGVHDITYQALDTFIYTGTVPSATLVCSVDTIGEVTVRPLPVPNIQMPVNNQRFCSSDTITPIITNTNNSVLDTFFSDEGGVLMVVDTILSTITVGGITYTVVDFDTTYSFDPGTATIGTNIINYTVFNNFGCSDSIQYTYLVDGFKEAEFALDSVFCESEDSVVLFGVPSGGRFLRDNDTVAEPSFFVPNSNYVQGVASTYIDSFLIDTMVYVVQDGACFSSDTQYVRINGVPRLTLEGPNPLDNYCLIDDTLTLNLQPMGGTLTGAGVLFNRSDMILSIAGAGVHTLYYTYQDSTTGCVNTATDTFRVYGQPEVNFAAIGGCQSDSIFFWPDNQILGLNNQFSNGQPIDSITQLYWDFDGSGSILTVNGNNTLLDSFHHTYNTPGVYYPQLIVTNQNTCTDTASIRLVISPLVQNYPYDETFQASNGDWYAEDRDATQSQLWQWGADNNSAGIDGGTNGNLFWETNLNSAYSINEDGWVYGPCFDLDTLNRPMIKLDYWSDSRENVDGTVLEYQQADGQWKPLGQIGNGISWYDTPIITGQPGDQDIAPIGWSGQTNGWTDARYRLDEFLTTGRSLRMRVAFGSPAISLGSDYYDGFAFDNVWVGDRTRNVLLETSSDITLSNMMRINNHVYSLIFNTELNKDVTLVQYNCCLGDEFYLDNIDITDKLNIVYGNSSPGKAYINGATNNIPPSLLLNKRNFEEDMLQDPKFIVEIDTFYTDAQNLTVTATVTAKENLPMSNYRIHTIVTEDSLLYDGTLDMIQAVARKDDESQNTFNTDWIPGQWETVTLNWNHGSSTVNYNPNNFQVVVFIQDLTSREVFQVNSSRDVSGYLIDPTVNTNTIADQDALESIRNMKLYPNPSASYFQVDFDMPLEEEYQWRLVDMRGVEVQSGTLEEGAQDLRVENQALPTGMYIFTVQNGRVFSQKKVIINQK